MPHAIRIHAHGGPEVMRWESVETPEPGPGQALVRHTAVGVNFIDVYERQGLYPNTLPSGLGREAAGVVEAVGPGVRSVRVGDPSCRVVKRDASNNLAKQTANR